MAEEAGTDERKPPTIPVQLGAEGAPSKLLDPQQDIHKISVPLKSEYSGKTHDVPLSKLVSAMMNTTTSGDDSIPPIPRPVNFKGERAEVILTHYAKDAEAEVDTPKEKEKEKENSEENVPDRKEVAAAQQAQNRMETRGPDLLNPDHYHRVLSQMNYYTETVDLEFLSEILSKSGLATEFRPEVTGDSMKTGFTMRVPNIVTRTAVVELPKAAPVFAYSCFHTSIQSGMLAKDMSNGTDHGFELIKADWVVGAFNTIIQKTEAEMIPLLFRRCDLTRLMIDQSTAIFIRCHQNLPYERAVVSMEVNRGIGFITALNISGFFEKKNYADLVRGILLLISNIQEFRKAGETHLKEIDRDIEAQMKELKEGNETVDINKVYADQISSEGKKSEEVAEGSPPEDTGEKESG